MKNPIQFFLMALISLAALFSGCKSSSPKEVIINKWKVTKVEGDTPESQKRAILNKTTLEFTKEGSYILSGTDHDQAGTYWLSGDNRWLVFKIGNNYIDSSRIESLTRNKLQLINQDVVMTLVPQ